jgi:hypothetical protein
MRVYECFDISLIVQTLISGFILLYRIPNDEESDEEESDEEEFEEEERPRGRSGKGKAASVQKEDTRIKGGDDPALTRVRGVEDPAASRVKERKNPAATVSVNWQTHIFSFECLF